MSETVKKYYTIIHCGRTHTVQAYAEFLKSRHPEFKTRLEGMLIYINYPADRTLEEMLLLWEGFEAGVNATTRK